MNLSKAFSTRLFGGRDLASLGYTVERACSGKKNPLGDAFKLSQSGLDLIGGTQRVFLSGCKFPEWLWQWRGRQRLIKCGKSFSS
ncbi:MAG: hypothetical protein RL417_1743 [Pseudomonadota bacterium]|jgi:hypothetical protein